MQFQELSLMDDWNQKTHGQSGLIQRVRDLGIPISEAEMKTREIRKKFGSEFSFQKILVSFTLTF